MVKHSQVVVHVRRHYVRGTYASILKATTTLVLQSLCFHKICMLFPDSQPGWDIQDDEARLFGEN